MKNDTLEKPSKIIVAMSGGVDSSVSALLLKQQGHDVAGLFMKNWEEDDTASFCAAAEDVADAQTVCEQIGIPLHTVNFAAEYWDNVFQHFLAEYKAGRTPNPDILCNREIKFKVCFEHARQLGADYFATGHYAQIAEQQGQYQLLKGNDANKDQTYFIYPLTQAVLAKTLFPIGHLPKSEVRKIAKNAGLKTHNKKDSTGICFIGEKRFRQFLAQYLPNQPGNIETLDGEILGKHQGVMYYTLGQREGLGIGGQRKSNGQPWYVIQKDVARNVLIVAQGHDHPRLFSKSLNCEQLHWITEIPLLPLICTAKTRYRQAEQLCQVTKTGENRYTVNFEQPQWAVTPGQAIVFYEGNVCLGGGVIVSTSV